MIERIEAASTTTSKFLITFSIYINVRKVKLNDSNDERLLLFQLLNL